jgi:hypothetical protein
LLCYILESINLDSVSLEGLFVVLGLALLTEHLEVVVVLEWIPETEDEDISGTIMLLSAMIPYLYILERAICSIL